MSQKKNKKKKKNIFLRIVTIILVTIITLGFLGGVAFAGIMYGIVQTAPKLDLNAILNLNEPSVLYYSTKDGKDEFMDEAPTLEKREIVSINDVPNNLKNAFISIEDERFMSHNGLDFRRILGAVYIDVERFITKKSGLHGASTITQQLLKNTVLTPEVSIKRKVQEMYLAMELEKALSKDQILEAYLNTIFLGGSANGIQKAAKQYFNKDVNELNLIQCAYIAGVTQNPSVFYPFSSKAQKDPSVYLNRTKTVLSKMKETNSIDEATYLKAIDDLNNNQLVFEKPKTIENANRLAFEWFSRPVMDAVKADLKAQYHYSSEEVEKLLMYGGLKIYTTMDKDLQVATEKIMNDDKNYNGVVVKDSKGTLQPQSSAVVIDYKSGEVRAIVGGRGEQPPKSYNRAASSEYIRPTGSAIKPITVYSPAIDTKHATAATVIEDSPLPIEIGKQWPVNGKPYNPKNYDTKDFKGYVTLREALRRSINLVAIKLEYEIGLKTGLSYAEKFGIKFNKVDSTSISALSLGQFEGTNTLSMAAAFGTFGNNGIYNTPVLYKKVVDKTGKVLLENKTKPSKVLSPQSAYIMYDLLKGPTSNEDGATASNAKFSSMPVGGKTGTSSDNKDFWFAGLTPYYSGAVWIGNDIPQKYSNIYSSTSAGIWAKIMAEAHKSLPVKDVTKPEGIKTALVCSDSGKIPTDLCAKDPRGSRVYEEIFLEGTVPTTLCDVHTEVKINKANGKLATEYTPKEYIENRVFIKRTYTPSESLVDQKYVAPTEVDDTKPDTSTTKPSNNSAQPGKDKVEDTSTTINNTNNNSNKNNSTTPQ